MGFLMPSTPSAPTIPAAPPAAAPATMASPAIAATAANQRARALAAAGTSGASNPDLAAAPQTAKPTLLGPSQIMDAKEDKKYSFYEKAGPATLAEQPSIPTKKEPEETLSKTDWNLLRSHLEGRLGMLRTWRDTWWIQNWSDLARFILPRRSIWLTQSAGGLPSPNSMTRGLEINEAIVDPTATFATRICSGGLMSGLASPSRPWFKIIPAMRGVSIDGEGREWLDNVEEIVYTVLARSNFYNSFAQECEDIVVYGTSVCLIYEDEKDLIRCYTPCAGEYYLASGATMRVDGLYRAFVMTVAQIVDFFGIDNCPPDIQKLWKEKGGALATERLIAHSIEPNFAISGSKIGRVKGKFTWREVYWIYGAGTPFPLSMRGFVDQPFTAARWATQSNDAYGRSPGMDVLPDVMQLQVETMRKAEGIEKGLRPPLLASADLKNQPTSQLPGHVTFASDIGPGKGMRSIYDSKFDLDHVSQDIALIQQRIKSGLFNDLFLMLEGQQDARKTATEIQAKLVEKMNVLGPVIEGLLSESLQPKLQRIFSILKRTGMIPPPPKSLQNVPLDIQFVSLLALAQKAASTGGIEALVKMAGEIAQIKPDVVDNLNGDDILSEYNDLLGNKQKILLDPQIVSGIRKQRADEQAKQQQAAMAAHATSVASTAAQTANTLSQTDVGSGQTALNALMGSGGGGQ